MMENVYDQTGRIFDIQRYSLHDGPGIRTIVFFKGCHLRCRWCCNPESQEYGIQAMNMNGTTKTVGRDVTVRELMSDLEKDRVYYERSGGGITLSGGECMAQPDFAEALLIACHRYGLTTAIETTAFADRAVVERLIPHVDYVLMDINGAIQRADTVQRPLDSGARRQPDYSRADHSHLQRYGGGDYCHRPLCGIAARRACAASAPLPPSGAG